MRPATGETTLHPLLGALRNGLLLKLALWTAFLIVLLALPLVSGLGTVSLLNQIGIAVVFALAYNLLLGQSGLLSFGHAVYYGVGAFWTIQLMKWVSDGLFYFPGPLVPLAGGLGGLFFGFVLGIFCVRRRGTIFALITLAVGELMTSLTLMLDSLSGGEEGISAWREPWLGFTFGSATEVYYVILAWVLVCGGLMYALTRTPFGRLMLAVRDNEERARFIGFNTYRVRLTVFSLSGMFSGVAGGLLAFNNELINYEVLGLVDSANVLFNTFVGGMGYFSGPIIGAALLTTLQLNLSNYTEAWLVYQGILFILVVLFAPAGIAGIVYVHRPVLSQGLWRLLLRAYGQALLVGVVLLLAGIFVIEFIYAWSNQSYGADAEIPLFWVTWSPASLWPWLVMIVGLGGSVYLVRNRVAPAVREAWERVNERLNGGEES